MLIKCGSYQQHVTFLTAAPVLYINMVISNIWHLKITPNLS